MTEITVFTKAKGPLTKRITLADDGTVLSDGSECRMARGRAVRVEVADVTQLAALITSLRSNQALALGALRDGLSDKVTVVTKDQLNGPSPDLIARTSDALRYRERTPAYALLDYDTKGMPPEVAARIESVGGFWKALASVLPDLESAGHILRRSTSAGLRRADTDAELTGSGGWHGYVAVSEGSDIERFLYTLHDRTWLAGLGWYMVGVGGQLLERSIIDRMVGAPERLVFEGPPILKAPLTQDAAARTPIARPGGALDTVAVCPPLTVVETQSLRKLKAEAAQALLPARNKAREAYVEEQAAKLVARNAQITPDEAARIVEQQCRGVLLPDIILLFDDTEVNITVADILDDPAGYDGLTLADPIEGIDYGRCKAKVMRRADGTPWIKSFAHGHIAYQLKYDERAVRVRVDKATDPINVFVRLALSAELDEVEEKQLIDLVVKRSGVGPRPIAAKLKSAKAKQSHSHAEERRARLLAERNDPRPQLARPIEDAPWLPQVAAIDEVAARMSDARQPNRNIDGTTVSCRKISLPNTHAFTTRNEEEKDDD